MRGVKPTTEGGYGAARALGRSSTLSGNIKPDPLIGTRHRNYRIVSVCGEGTLSRVYKAHDAILDRNVALKVTRPGDSLPAWLEEDWSGSK